jgi:class 3 adenylate cyclase
VLVETDSADHGFFFGDSNRLVAEAQRWLRTEAPATNPDRVVATVVFTDIVGSTARVADLGDQRWRELLERHDALVREQVDQHDGNVIKTTGDGFFASFDGPLRAMRCAAAIVAAAKALDLDVRVGVHTGECEFTGNDLLGMTVNIGARVAALAGPGEVLVSRTVKDLAAGSGIGFADRGRRQLKGVPGEWDLFAVRLADPRAPARPVPGPRASMRTIDRIAVRVARTAPSLLRLGTRLVASQRP